MRHARHAGFGGHVGDAQGARHPADVAEIGLDDIHGVHVDHALPLGQAGVLLAPRDGNVQRGRDLRGPFEFPVGAGLFEVAELVLLEQLADLDRFGGRETAIAIGQQRHIVANGLPDRGGRAIRCGRATDPGRGRTACRRES